MDKNNYVITDPAGIERESMEIIGRELSHVTLPEHLLKLVKRVIHTTADFEYAHLVEAHPGAVDLCKEALKGGCKIYADTSMIVGGISKPSLARQQCSAHCFVHDQDVVAEALARGITRSIVGVDKAARDETFKIFIFGNAPTALVRLCELYKEGKVNPGVVIGVPVGFVGAAESKEMLKQSGMPYIITRGRKGGSTVGVAMINSLLYDL